MSSFWHRAKSHLYKHLVHATTRLHRQPIEDSTLCYCHATGHIIRKENFSDGWRTHRSLSMQNTNCIARGFYLECASIVPILLANRIHRHEWTIVVAHISDILQAARPWQLAICCDQVHSRRTSPWCSPCNLSSQKPNRIYNLCWACRSSLVSFWKNRSTIHIDRIYQPGWRWKTKKMQLIRNKRPMSISSPGYIFATDGHKLSDHFPRSSSKQTMRLFSFYWQQSLASGSFVWSQGCDKSIWNTAAQWCCRILSMKMILVN